MKLRNLNGAIRKQSGGVRMTWQTAKGPVEVEVVKSSLLEALKATYGLDASVETYVSITPEGLLVRDEEQVDQASAAAAEGAAPPAGYDDDPLGLGDIGSVAVDLDDLLG